MAYGQDVKDSMAAGFARAGVGSDSDRILSDLARLQGTEAMAQAHVEAAGLHAAGQVSAAEQYRLGYMSRRAEGGPVEKGRPYLGGEEGPEVVIPNRSLADVTPGRRADEWEDLGGGLRVTSDSGGTYNRPVARQVVPRSLDLSRVTPENRAAMESGQFVHQPIPVMRGMRTSYAGGSAGQEWRSLDRAARAGRGEYMPTVAEEQHQRDLEKIKEQGKHLDVAGQQARVAQTEAHNYLGAMLRNLYGIKEKDAKGNPVLDAQGNPIVSLPEDVERARLEVLPQIKNMHDVPKLLEQMKPRLETGRQIAALDTEANRAKMLANVRLYQQSQGIPPDAGTEKFILTGNITPENYKAYLGWLNYGAGQTQPTKPVSEAPNLIDAATLLGSRMKYELSPPGTIGEKILGRRGLAPTLESIAAQRIAERNRIWEEESPGKTQVAKRIPAMAEGGEAEKDQPYLIGEKGPEIFVPKTDGMVIPNSSLDLSALTTGPGVKQSQYDEVSLGGKG